MPKIVQHIKMSTLAPCMLFPVSALHWIGSPGEASNLRAQQSNTTTGVGRTVIPLPARGLFISTLQICNKGLDSETNADILTKTDATKWQITCRIKPDSGLLREQANNNNINHIRLSLICCIIVIMMML